MFNIGKNYENLKKYINSFSRGELYRLLAIISANLGFIIFVFYSKSSFNFFVKVIITTGVVVLIVTHQWVKNVRKQDIFPLSDLACLLLIGAIGFSLYSLHSARYGVPLPQNADEYSYLLMGKTFAEGRLANPPHPMRAHFDNFHIINEPSFASKYPPAQGIILAFGIFLFGSPIIGVWLSGAFACMAAFWMLRSFNSRKWSFIGALLTMTFPVIFTWSMGYFYGFAALLGILLCLGALFRIVNEQKVIYALILGFGIAVLSNSRPWEGLLACVPILVFIIVWIFGRIKDAEFLKRVGLKLVMPVTAVLILNFSWIAFYNYSVTGDALKMPYSVYNEQYDPIPLFLPLFSSQELNKEYLERQKQDYLDNKITRSRIMREFHLYEFDGFYIPTVLKFVDTHNSNVFVFLAKRAFTIFRHFLWLGLYVYLFVLITGLILFPKSRRFLFLFGSLTFCFFVDAVATYQQPHYYAPFYGYLLAGVIFVLSRASKTSESINILATSFAIAVIIMQIYLPFSAGRFTQRTFNNRRWEVQAVFEKPLQKLPGKLLVLVDYSNANFLTRDRYLYITNRSYFNDPDIDRSKIVWANSLDSESDKKLFEYFNDRDVWILGFGDEDAEIGDDECINPKMNGLYPKMISCSGQESVYPPKEELKESLQKLCLN